MSVRPEGGCRGRRSGGPPLSLLIAGTYERSDAYPNVVGRIETLLGDTRLDALERHVPATTRIDHSSTAKRLLSSVRNFWRLARGCVRTVASIARHRHRSVLYVPYPSLFVLFALSLLPRRARPERVVADAFISVYDTVVHDRRLLRPHRLAARTLRRLERRAFATADRVVVDTVENAEHYHRLFGLSRDRFVALPLATPYRRVSASAYDPGAARLRIVFLGTMVPLHGIDVLCDAVRLLPLNLPVDVRFYGDGQCAGSVRSLMQRIGSGAAHPAGVRVFWHRDWLDVPEAVRAVSKADLCVGVLGTTAKADRVWPFKNYLYAACGRALVNARTTAALSMARLDPERWFLSVPPGDASALATLIEQSVRERRSLDAVAAVAARVFERRLSGRAVEDALIEVLDGCPTANPSG